MLGITLVTFSDYMLFVFLNELVMQLKLRLVQASCLLLCWHHLHIACVTTVVQKLRTLRTMVEKEISRE